MSVPPEAAPPMTTTNYCPVCRIPVLLRDPLGTCSDPECRAKVLKPVAPEIDALICQRCGKAMGEHFDLNGRRGLGAWCYDDGSTRHFVRSSEAAPPRATTPEPIHGVTWLLIRDGCVALEQCEKKARVLGVGEWFVPGGKVEGGESAIACCQREMREEWPGVEVLTMDPLPIVEGSAVSPGPRGLFLMRPFVVTVRGDLPPCSGDGVPLRWVPIAEALASPVPQVRMMVAAAISTPLAAPAPAMTPQQHTDLG